MTRGHMSLGGRILYVYVPENRLERVAGLEPFSPPDDDEGMLFTSGPVWMARLSYPIDVILFDDGAHVDSWITLHTGDPRHFGAGRSVLEVAAGWAARKGLQRGDAIEWVRLEP
jgi:uncharacterized membrane protein (UPF0127 family)